MRPATVELAESLSLPVENLISPDALRRLGVAGVGLEVAQVGQAALGECQVGGLLGGQPLGVPVAGQHRLAGHHRVQGREQRARPTSLLAGDLGR